MRHYAALSLGLIAFIPLALGGCQSQGAPSLETQDQKASYAIGLQTGSQLAPAETHIDLNAVMAGIRDGMAGKDPAAPQAELQAALQSLGAVVSQEQQERAAVQGESNAAEGEAFLARNANKEGVTVTESGLQYEVLREGDGPRPGPEDQVSVNYKGTLIDGTQFDSSYDRGQPNTFGVNGVIQGFSEGLQLMPVGSHYRFYIPSDLAYGANGAGPDIGPNATLIFDVELLEIVK